MGASGNGVLSFFSCLSYQLGDADRYTESLLLLYNLSNVLYSSSPLLTSFSLVIHNEKPTKSVYCLVEMPT
jgi:hypothetical protein